jgi:hypothetical protein
MRTWPLSESAIIMFCAAQMAVMLRPWPGALGPPHATVLPSLLRGQAEEVCSHGRSPRCGTVKDVCVCVPSHLWLSPIDDQAVLVAFEQYAGQPWLTAGTVLYCTVLQLQPFCDPPGSPATAHEGPLIQGGDDHSLPKGSEFASQMSADPALES